MASKSTPPGLLEVGDYLHASCSDCIYGEVVALGTDANGAPCVDLRIFEPDELLSWPDAEDENGQLGVMGKNKEWPDFAGLVTIELPEGAAVILRGLHYKYAGGPDEEPGLYRWGKYPDRADATHGDEATHTSTGQRVVVLTPGDGCYRCTKLFSVARRAEKEVSP